MCRFLLLCLSLMYVGITSGAEERETVFRIDGAATSVEEFVHYYARIHAVNGVSTENFLPHFLYYKLKVADAKKQGWDTLPDFRLQCNVLQNEMGRGMERSGLKSVPIKWVKFRQISILLPQHVAAAQERRARQRMDSIYAALKKGADFEVMARNCFPETGVSPYADGEWIPEICLVKEFSEQLDALKKNDFSAPFFSPLGIHIVCLLDCKQEDCSESKSDITDMPKDNKSESDSLELKQIAEGLLAAYWDKRHVEGHSGAVSDKDLQDYFEAHKKEYEWELPHFKGGVVYCLNKKAASKLKKMLKKLPLNEWKKEIDAFSRKDPSLKAEVETGLFQIGSNPYVDKLAFKCGHFMPRTDLPYTFILGKRLKKGPEEFTDVRGEVQRDYRLSMEKSRLEVLKQSFKIEINQDILKTVNCSGKK